MEPAAREGMRVSPETLNEITARWAPAGRSGLLPALIEAQEALGWLSPETIAHLADGLGVPRSDAFGVADFYAHLYTHPVGKTIVRVCDDVPCYLAGSEKVCAAVEKRLGLKPGETSADGAYTYEIVPCLGHCDHGPVVMVGHQVHEDVTPARVDEILDTSKG